MGRTLQRTVGLAATALVGCSLFIDTSGFVSDATVDAQAESGAEVGSNADAAVDATAIDDATTDSVPPADVLVDGPVDASVCPPPPNDPSLKGWYLFDEGSGTTVVDCSTSQRHGLQANGTWTTGKKGGGLAFNGTTSCVTLPAGLALLTGFTVTAWVNVVSFAHSDGDSRFVVSKSDGQYKGWAFKVDSPPHYELTLGQGGTTRIDLSTTGEAPANVWTHIAAVYLPNARSEIWVNGALSITSPTPPASFVDDPNAPPRIGCRNAQNIFSGIIDEVRIYDRALNANEIPALAQ